MLPKPKAYHLFLCSLILLLRPDSPQGFKTQISLTGSGCNLQRQKDPFVLRYALGWFYDWVPRFKLERGKQHPDSVPHRFSVALPSSEKDASEDMQDHPDYKDLFEQLKEPSARGQAFSQLWNSDAPFSLEDYKALLIAACQLGKTYKMLQILQEMRIITPEIEKDVYDMCMKISVARYYWRQSVELLKDMLSNGQTPGVHCFNAALYTCNRTNLRAGLEIYYLMKNHNVTPNIKCLTILITLATRGGDHEWALKFINEVKILNLKPDPQFIRHSMEAYLRAKEYTAMVSAAKDFHDLGVEIEINTLARCALTVLIEAENPELLELTYDIAEELEISPEHFEELLGNAFNFVFRNSCRFNDAISALEMLQSYGVSLGMRGFTAVVSEAIRAGENEYAAELVKEIESEGMVVREEVYVRLIKDCVIRKDYEQVLKYYEILKFNRRATNNQHETNPRVVEHVIKAKTRLCDFHGAIDFFSEIKEGGTMEPTFDMYAEILVCYSRLHNWEELVDHMVCMQQLFTVDSQRHLLMWLTSYTIAIRGAGMLKDEEKALQFLEDMTEIHGLRPTLASWSAAIGACSKSGKVQRAFEVFESMIELIKDPLTCVPFNALMTVCQRNGEPKRVFEAFGLFAKYNVQPDSLTYSILISVCAQRGSWKQVKYLLQKCPEAKLNSFILLGQIADFDCVRAYFETLLKERSEVNLDLFLGYLNVCRTSGNWKEAVRTLNKMNPHKVSSPEEVYLDVIRILQGANKSDEAFEIFLQMESRGLQISEPIYKTLLKLFLERRHFKKLYTITQRFRDSGLDYDFLAYLSSIAASAQMGKANEVAQYYKSMKNSSYTFNIRIYVIVTHCFLDSKMPSQALNVLRDMYKDGIVPNQIMYLKILKKFRESGSHRKTLEVFEEMRFLGHRPNQDVYMHLLQVCRDGQLAEESVSYLKETHGKGISVSPEMYNCVLQTAISSSAWSSVLKTVEDMKENSCNEINNSNFAQLQQVQNQIQSKNHKDLELLNEIWKIVTTMSISE